MDRAHPEMGERVHVRPTNPAEPVQRGEHCFGQFLPKDGMACTWDGYLQRRWAEGSIRWKDIEAPTPAEENA